MLRIRVDKLKPGMVLARPVRNPANPRVNFLNRGVKLDWKTIQGLARLKAPMVWITFGDLDFLDGIVNEQALEAQAEIYVNIRKSFSSAGRMTEAGLDGDTFRQGVSTFFDALAGDQKNMQLLHHLEKFDNYLYGHCVNVCSLTMMLALKVADSVARQRSFTELRKSVISLGVGALLHDIGKLRVPREILDKPGRLTPDEFGQMKQHTVHGFDILRNEIDPSSAAVALHHHQRFDGVGYPDTHRLKGKEIHLFARIATLADVYDAATSARCYSPAKPAVQAISEMKTMKDWFDPVLAEEFFRMMPPFPLGSIVTLSDGSTAAVVDFDPDHPLQPDVRLLFDPAGKPVKKVRELSLVKGGAPVIVKLEGCDVTAFTRGAGEEEVRAA